MSATLARSSVSAALLAGIVILAVAAPRAAHAEADSSEYGFPLESTLGERTLKLNGDGRLKYKWGILKFHLYDAALYASEVSKEHAEVLPDKVAKKLVLEFARKIDQKKMREAFSKSFEVVAEDARRKKHEKTIESFLAAVRAVDDEHRWVISTAPGEGLTVTIRNKESQSFGDADFAELFFELYLAPKAPNDGLRKDLLGS